MKYIVYEGGLHQMIVLFPRSEDHWRVAQALTKKDRLVSAGSVELGDDGVLHCYGSSTSLNLRARGKEDTQLLLRMLTGP